MKKPIVVIIGRPNVGKSTFFNRLVGKRVAIVEDTPGVTRDRNYAHCNDSGREFILVDTGGLEPGTEEGFLPLIRAQTEIALEESDIVLFLLDAREGLMPADREILHILRKAQKPVFYVINKVDNAKVENTASEFFALGAEKLYPVSADHGRGVDDLLEGLLPLLPESPSQPEEEAQEPVSEEPPRIAVVGRPNAGKSTLINTLLRSHRLVTSPIPGTTRDAIDTLVTYHRKPYCFVDTAGIRKKARVTQGVETYSVIRSLRSIDQCDLAILVTDGVEGVTDQDARIAQHIQEAGKGTILVINKWDLVPKDDQTMDRYREMLHQNSPFLSSVPILFLSALHGQRVSQIYGLIDRVMEAYSRRIPTGQINRFFQEITERASMPAVQGREPRFLYGTQVGIRPPSFVLFSNRPKDIPRTFNRFIENRLREKWGFEGVPLRIKWRQK